MSVEGVEHRLQRAAETFRVGVRWQLGEEKEKKRDRERSGEFFGKQSAFSKRDKSKDVKRSQTVTSQFTKVIQINGKAFLVLLMGSG